MINYLPDRGDVVWIDLDPQKGPEQAGRRPAIILSPQKYNIKVGLALMCPITSQAKGYPFEVPLPEGFKIKGAILADQIKSLDWGARKADLIFKAPEPVVRNCLEKINAILNG